MKLLDDAIRKKKPYINFAEIKTAEIISTVFLLIYYLYKRLTN